MGRSDTETVQTTLVPPSLAWVTLQLRYDTRSHVAHLAITVKDGTDGDLLATAVRPFVECASLHDVRSAASAMLERYTELVLNPEPF